MGTSKLKMILCERDITIKELAAATRVPYGTVVSIVNGRRPHVDNAYLISDALGMHISKVFPNLYDYARLNRKYAR